MTFTHVEYTGDNTGRNPSPALWKACPWLEILVGHTAGRIFYDDFLNPQVFTSAGTNNGGYVNYEDTGVTFLAQATRYGEYEVAGNDADNDEMNMSTGGNAGCMGIISDATADKAKLWFEARVRKASIADEGMSMFIGMSAEGLTAADVLVDDTGELMDADFVGFHNLLADGDSVDFCWEKAGGAIVRPTALQDIYVPVADEYAKLGFVYDPDGCQAYGGKSSDKIAVFVDGVVKGYATATHIATATFPDGEELVLQFATKVGTTDSEFKARIDWWRFAQLG